MIFSARLFNITALFLLLLGSSLSGVAQNRPDQWSNQQILDGIALDPQPERNFYINDLRVELLKKELAKNASQDSLTQIQFTRTLALELLRAGQSIEAIEELGRIGDLLNGLPVEQAREIEHSLEWLLATAYLRLGEQYNCLINHQAQSCIFPISKSAVHIATEGSDKAAQYLTKILMREPGSLAARWLLNLAYMTLGQYPDKVPDKWLLPQNLFSSEKQLSAFNDIAGSLGVDHNGLAGGTVVDDLNGDGYLDIAATSWDPRTSMKLYINNADGSFSDTTDKANLSGQRGGLNLTQADYDNDGDIDLLVFRGAWLGTLGEPVGNHPNSLLQNDGSGQFTDVTVNAGLGDLHPVHSGAWADFDLDGNLDLFLGNESSQDPKDPKIINAHRYQLFKGDGKGGFKDVAKQAGLGGVGFVKGVSWGDIDNDGYPDLYVSRLGQPNQLFHNVESAGGSRKFVDITKSAGVSEPILSFPVWFWDFNNDGWEDLFVASYTSFFGSDLKLVVADYLGKSSARYSRLYRNNGDDTFEDVTLEMNMNQALLAMGANYGDLDNDGFLDAYIGTGQPALISLMPNRMLKNEQGKRFDDVTTTSGLGHLQKGHGIAFADFDNDGDQDVYAVMGGAYSGDNYRNAMFENPGNDNAWITLKLEGAPGTNRSAIGARIIIAVSENGHYKKIYKTVSAGGSFGSGPLRQTIGLGGADSIRDISVSWPNAGHTVEVFSAPPLNQALLIKQSQPGWTVMPLEKFSFNAKHH